MRQLREGDLFGLMVPKGKESIMVGASWQQAGMAARQAAEISNSQTSMKQKELKAR